MTTLCFGGSFNPIHHGHLLCARAVAEACGFDRVLLIPSAVPPHKMAAADLAGASHRLAMCQIASAEQAGLFDVDDLELQRAGPSFTVDTARELKARGIGEVHWLIGSDTIAQLPTWREPEALLAAVNFVVIARPGWAVDAADLPPSCQPLVDRITPAPQIDISATNIRERARRGQSLAYLTPRGVAEYIARNGLYGTAV